MGSYYIIFFTFWSIPLSAMYKVFWQFPKSQFVGTSLAGMIFGYFYMKREYETGVRFPMGSPNVEMAGFTVM